MYNFIKSYDVGPSHALNRSIESIKKHLEHSSCVNDQPGAIRYHLDNEKSVTLLLPWIESFPVQQFISKFFGHNDFFVCYVRCRSPLKNQGQQKYHKDWFVPHERLEVFIALDSVDRKNGPLQIITATGSSKFVFMKSGDICIIDSETLHRGTENISGKNRRLVSLHIASQLSDDEAFVAYFKAGTLSKLQ